MSRNSSMWLDYQRWLHENGLDLPKTQEQAHKDEIPFDTEEDEDPTSTLRCARCRLPYNDCGCARGPVRWPEAGELPFEALNPKDADQ